MAKQNTTLLAALAGALCAAMGAVYWLSSRPATREPSLVAAEAPGDLARVEPAAAPLETLSAPRSNQGAALSATGERTVETSVAWPVKVELELLRGLHVPRAKDAPPMGSGAQARLRGRLTRGESGIAGKLTFTGGANAGRVLTCNERGEFGALDLYPGLAEVHVEGPGVEAMREVRLRAGQAEELNISYDMPGQVYGQVFDRESKGLEGVDVELDGQHARSDAEGLFYFPAATGGDAVQLILRKAGFATLSSRVAVAAGRVIEKGRYVYTMYPAATLELTLGPRVGGREDAVVILLPEVTNTMRSYPWHRVSPVRVRPGTTLRIDDLPGMRVSARVYHDGALADPEVATVFLQSGQVERHEVRFQAAPAFQGIVQDEKGLRVENARVVCEAPDRTGATLQYLSAMPRLLEEEIIPTLPPAASEARTNFNGEFSLSSWSKFGDVRYLWAESADGKLWGGRAVTSKDSQVLLTVAPIEDGRATLALDFLGRHQGLPVVVTIAGRPREEVIVPADEALEIGGLATGAWRIRVAWNGKALVGGNAGQELGIAKDTRFAVSLPAEAIQGQDADTLLRAGRSLPSFLVPGASDGR
ncbi:MAG: hypothetical protein IT454_11505 [Planctomycetes bacterium]|nr:hypothetical protein [Planctomycetota bacterium]